MYLYVWYLGALLKFLVSGRLITREWCRHLPCFSAFVFVCTIKSVFLIPLYGTELYGDLVRLSAPLLICLQVAASIEAFIVFTSWAPKFRNVGWVVMLISIVIAFALVQWTEPENKAALSFAATAALERGFGLGVAVVLTVAMFSYSRFDRGRPRAAYWHACCLAVLSLTNAIGWQLIQQKVPTVYPTWIMVVGGALPFAGWLMIVKEAPTEWKLPLPASLSRQSTAERSNAAATH